MGREYKIKQLMSAPGWRAMSCRFDDDDSEFHFEELSVIGWGVLECTYDGEVEDEIKLVVYDPEIHSGIPIRAYTAHNEDRRAFSPSENPADYKEEMKDSLKWRMGLTWKASTAA